MKIQGLSARQRQVIVWAVVAVLGSVLFFWWGGNVRETLKNVSLPEVPKELKESMERSKEELTFPAFEEIEEVLQEL